MSYFIVFSRPCDVAGHENKTEYVRVDVDNYVRVDRMHAKYLFDDMLKKGWEFYQFEKKLDEDTARTARIEVVLNPNYAERIVG